MESSSLFLFFILVLRTLLNCSNDLVSDKSAQELYAPGKDFQRCTSDASRKRKCFKVIGTRVGAGECTLTYVAKDGVIAQKR